MTRIGSRLLLAGYRAQRQHAGRTLLSQRLRAADESGQAMLILLGILVAVLILAIIFGSLALGINRKGETQRGADIVALATARQMHSDYSRLFEMPTLDDGRPNPRHLEREQYLQRAREAGFRVAWANGFNKVAIGFPEQQSFAPVRVRVIVSEKFRPRNAKGEGVRLDAVAEAELAPPMTDGLPTYALGGGYSGPLEYRQNQGMRPDVAPAFDRMAAAARREAGLYLTITSGYRSDDEQAILFRRNPNPKMVAPPGKSLHRMGTELDLGPPSAYRWLAANASRFHFLKRYSWEPWHFGYTLNARSTPRGPFPHSQVAQQDGERASLQRIPNFVPTRYAGIISRAAQQWSVSATLLSAQLYVESNFNPLAISSAGARGIAQFMPETGRAIGLRNPFNPAEAIPKQAQKMRNLLRRFSSVPLALAAYNAGEGAVARYNGIPPYRETRAYVAKILALMSGAGETLGMENSGLIVKLVK